MRQLLFPLILFLLVSGGKNAIASDIFNRLIFSEMIDTTRESVIVDTTELQLLDLNLPDGGLQPQPGVINTQIFRATRDDAEKADGDGWTYAHHMDLAIWKGRMYAAWNMTPKDEDRPPSKVVYATSQDGFTWTMPTDLFPREWAWACRFYFFRAHNDRMLTFCAANNSQGAISEDKKSILLVREISADHKLGDVYTLVNPRPGTPPSFESAPDKGFVAACREAAGNNMLLEQQDYGVFLGKRKMEWHEKAAPYKGFYKFGKALCFYHRADGILVGMSKMGFVTLSEDEGKSWSKPTLPNTLTAGSAKVWGQKTTDNRYILSYNPDPKKGKRFPLVLVQGDDGIHYSGMRVVHGEFSPIRYPGLYKDLGYQYVRGLAEWSSDSTLKEKKDLWLIYSVNKEDIWISRIPLPVPSEPASYPDDNFRRAVPGSPPAGWNLYCPKWAPVSLVKEPGHAKNICLELRDGDPVDHAQAARLFPATKSAEIHFRLRPEQSEGYLEAEVTDIAGHSIFRIVLDSNGSVMVSQKNGVELAGTWQAGKWQAGKWLDVKLYLDTEQGSCQLFLNGKTIPDQVSVDKKSLPACRLTFRTGKRYGINDKIELVAGSDRQAANPGIFLVDDVWVKPE